MPRAFIAVKDFVQIATAITSVGGVIDYQDSDCIVFHSDAFSGVCKIKDGMYVYHGTAWTSSETITDEILIVKGDTYGWGGLACCRVPNKIFALNFISNSNTTPTTAILGKHESGDTYTIGLDTDEIYNGNGYRNVTDNASGDLVYPYVKSFSPLLTSSGNYQMVDCMYTIGGQLQSDPIQNLKVLCRRNTTNTVAMINGDDVIITGGFACGDNKYFARDFIVIDGNV